MATQCSISLDWQLRVQAERVAIRSSAIRSAAGLLRRVGSEFEVVRSPSSFKRRRLGNIQENRTTSCAWWHWVERMATRMQEVSWPARPGDRTPHGSGTLWSGSATPSVLADPNFGRRESQDEGRGSWWELAGISRMQYPVPFVIRRGA
jgi:hypothetical protein